MTKSRQRRSTRNLREPAGTADGAALFRMACERASSGHDPSRYLAVLDLLRRAAATGFPAAHARLGDIYFLGLGVRRDWETALAHYATAATLGDEHADVRWRWFMALEGILWSRAHL